MFCGVATAVTILNALEIGHDDIPLDELLVSPADRRYLPVGDWTPVFHKWTQTTVLHANVKSKKQILRRPKAGNKDKGYGFQLHQFAELLSEHGAKVEFKEVMIFNASIDKQKMLNALKADGTYLVVNYARCSVGQKGGGHISPVEAYDQNSDTFLILDVNKTDLMWHWI